MKNIQSQVNDHKIRISLLEQQQKNAGDNTALLEKIEDLKTQINGNAGLIEDLQNEVNGNTADNSALQNQITDLQNQITELENKLQNVGSGETSSNVGTSVAEISALMNDFVGEEDFCTAANEKLQFGAQCKVEYAPHARIFFRHNPLKTFAPTITLGFWLSPLPSGITNLPATITLNGTTIFAGNLEITAASGEVAKITLPFNRAQCPMQVFNVLEVSFNDDANFANTFLDWINVEITQSQNCIILNRSTDHEIYGVKRTNNTHRFIDSFYQGAGITKFLGGKVDLTETTTYYDFYFNYIDDIHIKSKLYYYILTYNNPYFSFSTNLNKEFYITQENKLFVYCTYFVDNINKTYFLEKVLYAKESVHNGANEDTNAVCVVYQDFGIQLVYEDLKYSYNENFFQPYAFVLNQEEYPKEFVDFIPVYDSFVNHRNAGKLDIGYFLLHKSGNILFIPAMNSPYFIKLGKGRQVHASLSFDTNTITITYQQNQCVVEKKLTRENPQSDWALSDETNIHIDCQELYYCGDNIYKIDNKIIKK